MPAPAALFTGVSGVYFDYFPASFFDFVGKHFDKLTPASVADAFCKMVVLDHVPDLQIFDGDDFEVLDYGEACLVEEVLSLVGNPFMKFCNFRYRFSPVVASFLLSAQGFLKPAKPILTLNQQFGILNFCAVGEGCEAFDSDVYSGMTAFSFNLLKRHTFAREDSEPAPCSFLERQGLDFARRNSVKNNRDVPDFAHLQPCFRLELKAELGVSYTLVPSETFEAGKPGFDIFTSFLLLNPSEEMAERVVNPLAYVLEDLAMNTDIKLFSKFVQVVLGKSSFIFLVSGDFDFEKLIIDETAVGKSLV